MAIVVVTGGAGFLGGQFLRMASSNEGRTTSVIQVMNLAEASLTGALDCFFHRSRDSQAILSSYWPMVRAPMALVMWQRFGWWTSSPPISIAWVRTLPMPHALKWATHSRSRPARPFQASKTKTE